MEYKSSDVQRLFDKSTETVRTWAQEFGAYLSPGANPGEGRRRTFTPDDIAVFALVDQMKAEGRLYEDIHAALANGQRGEIAEHTIERGLSLETALALDSANRQIEVLQVERDNAMKEAQRLHDEVIKLQTQLSERERTADDLKTAQDTINELNRNIGKLEAQLEMLRGKA